MLRARANLLLTTFVFSMLGLIAKLPCAADYWSATSHSMIYLCYSDIGPLFFTRGLIDGVIPYIQQSAEGYVEYPVITGITMWLMSTVAHGNAFVFVISTWLLNVSFMMAAVYLLSSLNERAAWLLALAPALFFTLGINWDAAAVFAMVAALWAWQNQRHLLAGVAVGFGTSAKLFPVLLLVAFAADALNKRTFSNFANAVIGFVSSWITINAPFMLLNFDGWAHFYAFSRERGIDFGSPYLAIAYSDWSQNYWTPTNVANLISAITLVCATVFVMWKRKDLDLATTVLLLLSTFLLFNKVYSPQYWLWLSVVVALCTSSLSIWIVWNLTQFVYFVAVWRFILHGNTDYVGSGAIGESAYALAIIVMWVTTAAVVVNQVRSLGQPRPEHDLSHL